MFRLAFAILVAIHGAFQLFGASIAFGLVDAEPLYESLLVGGQLELASQGGTGIGVALLTTGLALLAGAIGIAIGWTWGLLVAGIALVVSLLVTALGERSLSGAVVNIGLLIVAWQLWRTEPAWVFRR